MSLKSAAGGERKARTGILQYFLISITSGLTVALIIWFFGKRRLYVVVPKLFPHSSLAERANTVVLTILNRGYKTEENIEIELDPALHYENIASTSTSATLTKGCLHISRVPGNDEVNVIILVEGGEFSLKSIAKVSSKECKGKVVDKPDHIFPAFGTLISAILSFIFIGVVFFAAGFIAKEALQIYVLYPELKPVVVPEALKDLGWDNIEQYVRSEMFNPSYPSRFPLDISKIKRTSATAIINVNIINYGAKLMRVNGELISPSQDINDVVSFGDTYFHDAIVPPGDTVTKTLKAFLPRTYKHQFLIAKFDLQYGDGHIYNLEKKIDLSH